MFTRCQRRHRHASHMHRKSRQRDHFTLCLPPALASRRLCPQFKQRTRWSTKLFWNNNNFLNEFIFVFFFLVFCFSVVVDCAAAHNVSSMYYYFFSFVVFAVWEAWGALFVDCGITSSTIYYWIFILGFSIDNNMCEYGFSLLFRSFFFAHTIYNFNSAAFKVYVWYMFCVRIFFFSIKYIFSLQRDSRGFFQYGL